MNQESQSNSSSYNQLGKFAPQPEEQQIKPQERKGNEVIHKAISLNFIKEKKPRLVIDHMVLEDFKSYAGKQIIGKFHGNFTSVVGPNGSGKSNLIESMLFIFGFNASWMRLNKLNQLIHNSSTSTGNNRAAVEVHFKKLQEANDGNLFEVPNSEFFIRRTVNSSSVSKYYIQGKQSTQGQVKERLKSQGIDLGNNRFLILQGQVEQISQMKQKSGDREKPGLLQYLQEIIGSSQYIQRIEQCGRQYAQAQQQKHEKGQLMKLVENQLKGMSKSKDEAVKYVKKQKKIFRFQNVYNQVMVTIAKQELKKFKEQLIQLQKIKERIVAEQRQKLKKQAQRIKDIKKNKMQMDEIQKKIQSNKEICNKMQIQDKHITQEITFKSQDLVKYEKKIIESDKEMAKMITQCQEIKQKFPNDRKILEERSQKLQQMRVQLSKYEKPALRQKIIDCQAQISKNDLQSKNLTNKLENVRQKEKKMKSGKGDIQSKIKEEQQKAKQNSDIKDKIEKAKFNAQKIIKQKKQKIYNDNSTRQNLKNNIRKIQTQLREQINENESQGNMGNMFREIMAQGFPGVLGRLGDLGQVSKEYDEIISTCCNKVDNIVVNDLQAAQSVLEFLKRKKIGRATCIILDKINQYRQYMNKPFENLPRSQRLIDVIKFKTQQAKIAFYFALGDTIFCQDNDLGLEYSMKNEHQRRRVISKNKNRGGYIIYEMNGLMVGSIARRGGFQKKAAIKGKQKNKDQNLIKELEQKKRQISNQMDQISKKIDKQQKQLKQTQQDLEQMRRQISSVQEIIKESQLQIKDLQNMMTKSDNNPNSSFTSQREIESLSKQITSLSEKKTAMASILKKLQNEQRQGQTAEINNFRQKYKQEKTLILQLEKQLQRQKAILDNSLKRMQDIKKGKFDGQRTVQKLKRQVDNLKAEQLSLEQKVTQSIGKMDAYDQRLKQLKKVEYQLRNIMQEDQKNVKQSKIKVEKVKKDVQVCQQSCNKQNENLKTAQEQLQKIRQHYKELVSTYSFMETIDQIDKMSIGPQKQKNAHEAHQSSILQTSMLNSSLDISQSKIFQVDFILRAQPYEDLNEDLLENFIFFKDNISGIITSESLALKKMEGSNLQIINEYRMKYNNYRERLSQFQAVRERQQELKRLIDGLKEERLRMFREGFGIINSKLKEVYQHLTRGGDAELQLIDALDPFSDGVNFSVRPPKKSWKQVNKLSGGQKTLSSLSLIFALHYYKPTPLYFMDEIDAALDFKNVSIVADYIKKRTKDAQFIIISLRNNMFDLANKLIGVYKTQDKTKVINLQPGKLLKQRQQRKENISMKSNHLNTHH